MIYTHIDHRSDVACVSTHVLNILTSLPWLIRVYKPWKIAVDLFFKITMTGLDVPAFSEVSWTMARRSEREKYHIISTACALIVYKKNLKNGPVIVKNIIQCLLN